MAKQKEKDQEKKKKGGAKKKGGKGSGIRMYDADKLYRKSLDLARDKKLLFIQDIIDFLPLSKATFYDYYPLGSDRLNELKKILDENKVSIKSSLRAKWYNSDNATLQMALYKLTSNDEEHRRLNQYYNKNETDMKIKTEKPLFGKDVEEND